MEDGQLALETERLILREMVEDDLEALLKVLGDAGAMIYYPAPFTRAGVSEWISWSRENYSGHGFGLWAMVLKATGDLIGDCGLTCQRVGYSPERQLEAGWHVRRDLWGAGSRHGGGASLPRSCPEPRLWPPHRDHAPG